MSRKKLLLFDYYYFHYYFCHIAFKYITDALQDHISQIFNIQIIVA